MLEVWGGGWEGWSLITSQNGPPLIHSPMCDPVPYLIVHWETSVHYTLITPSSTCKYNSCIEESSTTDVWINNEAKRNQAVGCKSFQPWSLVLASLNKCRSWPWNFQWKALEAKEMFKKATQYLTRPVLLKGMFKKVPFLKCVTKTLSPIFVIAVTARR